MAYNIVIATFILLTGVVFSKFPNILWNNFFCLLHLSDKNYLRQSNIYLGKYLILFAMLLYAISPFLSFINVGFFVVWVMVQVVLIPLSFEIRWRTRQKSIHS